MSSAPLLRTAALAYLPLAAAAALTAALAAIDGSSFGVVALLPPDPTTLFRDVLASAATGAGLFAFFAAPGLLAIRALHWRPPNAVAAALAALVLSSFLLAIAWIAAMTLIPGEGSRACAYLTAAAVDTALLLLGVRTAPGAPALPSLPRDDVRRDLFEPAAAIAATLLVGLLLFPGKLRVESLEGDATEVLGFGASLFHGAAPSWDLETGAWGYYPTFVFIAYPVFFSLAIGGVCEAAVRMPALLFLGAMMLAGVDLARRGARRDARTGGRGALPPVLAVGFLSLLTGAHYAGYHPFHGDLGCSPLEEWMVAGFAFAAVLLARDGAPRLAALAALLSILTFPSGLLFVALLGLGGVLSGSRAERLDVVRTGLWLGAFLAAAAAAILAHAASEGTLEPMLREWQAKYFAGRASFGDESPARAGAALLWFALLSGGVALSAMPAAALRGDRAARWLAFGGGAWVVFFLLSPAKNVHYFLPAALLPVVVALRLTFAAGDAGRFARFGPPALAASALACIAFAWPARVPPYTADRDFGRATVFLAGSLREAVEDSKLLYNFSEPLWRWSPGDGWTLGHHTWVVYSARPNAGAWSMAPAPGEPDPTFLVARGETPPRPHWQEISRLPARGGEPAILWAPRGREDWRAWRDRTYALRRDLSPFDFDMEPVATP